MVGKKFFTGQRRNWMILIILGGAFCYLGLRLFHLLFMVPFLLILLGASAITVLLFWLLCVRKMESETVKDSAFDSKSMGNLQLELLISHYTNTQIRIYPCKVNLPSRQACSRLLYYEELSAGCDAQH